MIGLQRSAFVIFLTLSYLLTIIDVTVFAFNRQKNVGDSGNADVDFDKAIERLFLIMFYVCRRRYLRQTVMYSELLNDDAKTF